MKKQLFLGLVMVSMVATGNAIEKLQKKEVANTAVRQPTGMNSGGGPVATTNPGKGKEAIYAAADFAAQTTKKHIKNATQVAENIKANTAFAGKTTGIDPTQIMGAAQDAYNFSQKHLPMVKKVGENIKANVLYAHKTMGPDFAKFRDLIMAAVPVIMMELAFMKDPNQKAAAVARTIAHVLNRFADQLHPENVAPTKVMATPMTAAQPKPVAATPSTETVKPATATPVTAAQENTVQEKPVAAAQ
jgi:hypothetical protein